MIFLVLYCARQIGNQHQPIFADKIWHHLFLWITEPFWFGLLPHCWSLKAGTAGTMLHPCRSWWGTLQPVWQPWKAWIGTTCSAVFVSTGRCLSKPVIYGFDGIHGIPLSTAVFTKNIVSFGPRSDLYIYIFLVALLVASLQLEGIISLHQEVGRAISSACSSCSCSGTSKFGSARRRYWRLIWEDDLDWLQYPSDMFQLPLGQITI